MRRVELLLQLHTGILYSHQSAVKMVYDRTSFAHPIDESRGLRELEGHEAPVGKWVG